MKVCQIIGQPDAGKTTLVTELVQYLSRRGCLVGSLKHTAHSYELDKPGKDTFLHRQAGASPVAMVTAGLAAVYLNHPADIDPLSIIDTLFAKQDVVLIEGWISGPFTKIEMFRHDLKKKPLFYQVETVEALVYDGPLPEDIQEAAVEKGLSIFSRDAIEQIAAFIEAVPPRQ